MRFARLQFSFTDKRLPPLTLHDALWWALAVAIAMLGAQLFWILVTPVAPLGDWRPASVRIMSPAARTALFARFDPFHRGAAVQQAAGPATVTSLGLTLFGVRINAATGAGSAIIAGTDGVQDVYRVGAEVMPGVTLAGLHFDHVVLSRNGSTELLYLDQSKPATIASASATPQSSVGVAPAAIPAPPAAPAPANALTVDAVRRGISFQPQAEGGRLAGFSVSAAGDGSAFRGIGFQPGDVVTSIAGKRVSSPADAAALSSALRPGGSVSVVVRRNGQELPLAITVPQ